MSIGWIEELVGQRITSAFLGDKELLLTLDNGTFLCIRGELFQNDIRLLPFIPAPGKITEATHG